MIKYVTFVDKNVITDILRREDSLVLTRKYLMSRFGDSNSTEGFQYMNVLISEADMLYAAVREKEDGSLQVLALALRDNQYITFFSSGAHSAITYRFMKGIVDNFDGLLVYTTVGIMEKLLTKLDFRLIGFEYGGRWYKHLPRHSDEIPQINKRPDGTIH